MAGFGCWEDPAHSLHGALRWCGALSIIREPTQLLVFLVGTILPKKFRLPLLRPQSPRRSSSLVNHSPLCDPLPEPLEPKSCRVLGERRCLTHLRKQAVLSVFLGRGQHM